MGIFRNIFKKKNNAASDNINISIDKNIKLRPGESLSRTPPANQRQKQSLNEQWQKISEQIQKHLQDGKIGLYACDLYSLSEIDGKEKRYNDQMNKLIVSAYIHLSGTEEFLNYQQTNQGGFATDILYPILPPAVIRDTKTTMKRLNMDISAYQNLFLQTIEPTMTPIHLYGVDGALKIISLYLNDEPEKAEKEIKRSVKKYIASHS